MDPGGHGMQSVELTDASPGVTLPAGQSSQEKDADAEENLLIGQA